MLEDEDKKCHTRAKLCWILEVAKIVEHYQSRNLII